jgi:hypothetical protein
MCINHDESLGIRICAWNILSNSKYGYMVILTDLCNAVEKKLGEILSHRHFKGFQALLYNFKAFQVLYVYYLKHEQQCFIRYN